MGEYMAKVQEGTLPRHREHMAVCSSVCSLLVLRFMVGLQPYCVRLEADNKDHQLGQQCQRTEDNGEGECHSKDAVLS